MKTKKSLRLLACLLLVGLLAALAPSVAAMPSWFFHDHTDWHFDLTQEPDRAMTVEEYIALVRAYSYWSVGIEGTAPRDRDGDLPADWAAPYVCEAASYGIIDPSELDYSEPITLGRAVAIMVHSKGLYGFNAINMYQFRGTSGLTNEERLCLNTAVDYGILQYTQNMDVSKQLPRRDLETKYLIPDPTDTPTPVVGQKRCAENFRYSMGFFEDCYNSYEESARQVELLKKNSASFNIVTIDAIYMMENKVAEAKKGGQYVGEFIEHPSMGEQDPQLELISYCKEQGITVLGGVIVYYDDSVFKKMQADESVMDVAVQELAEIVQRYDLDGINFDVEYTGNDYRAVYSKLVTKLSQRLHADGKMLMLTIGGYMWDKDEATTMYDYDVVREVADLATIITYDVNSALFFRNNPSAPYGEISSLTYTARSARYAASVIGADKVLLGLGGYGIDFNLNDRQKTHNITMPEVWALRDRYGAQEKTTDDVVDDRYFTYTENGEQHFVYYESPKGMRRRVELGVNYGLAGVAGFYIGGEYDSMFADIAKHLTDLPFTDLDPSQWYYEGAKFAVDNKLMNGISSSKFDPEGTMTRAMLVTVLWRYAGSPAEGANSFVDVPSGQWYTQAVSWAASKGIVNGTSRTTFEPDGNITREQMAAILYRYANYAQVDVSARRDFSSFPDSGSVSGYAKDALSWCIASGIINGSRENGVDYLLPQGNATRAQVATIFMRYIRLCAKG